MSSITSLNQSGFIRGRLLGDNVLLAQELFQDLQKNRPSPNLAIKLDMAKAYDRVQWEFLINVLVKMGFGRKWIGLIERCVNSNWFSVFINGVPGGFFKSERGLRQGDPLSPSLFILAAEYLSRCLDDRILGNKDLEYSTSKYSFGISHLAYADDILVFTKADSSALHVISACLEHYSAVSGQKINVAKSQFYLDEKNDEWSDLVQQQCGFSKGSFPFDYLGVPIFKGRKKSAMFLFLRDRISKRIHSWSHKHLSFGGRLALIKSTLGALPLHIFQVLEPTKEAVKKMESLIARYFWGANNDTRKTHWISWEQICHPIEEGGLGVRRFSDMIEAFGIKLWWRFRDQDSLWAHFLLAKYCHRIDPAKVSASKGNSPTWKRMLKVRNKAHSHIQWSIGQGRADFWDDIWLRDRPLREFCTPNVAIPKMQIRDFWRDNKWDESLLRTTLGPLGVPLEMVDSIVTVPFDVEERDTLRWDLTPHGNFSTTSAWNLVRHRQQPVDIYSTIWNRAIPPSASIFVWRLLANRIPVDVKLQWRNISLASKCKCCQRPKVESREHLFWRGNTSNKIWCFFASWFPDAPRIHNEVRELEFRIRFWHTSMNSPPKMHVSLIIPCLILWFIWGERNNVVHRGSLFNHNMVIERVIHQLQCATSAGILLDRHWAGCKPSAGIDFPSRCQQRMVRNPLVKWLCPELHWLKLNTDGAFNPSTSFAGGGGVVRDDRGRIVQGFSAAFSASSGIEAEIKAVIIGIKMAKQWGTQIWVEVDAQEIVDLLSRKKHGAAVLRHLIKECSQLLQGISSIVSHIHREGNGIAHWLAKQGSTSSGTTFFEQANTPNAVKAMAILDQSGVPSISRRNDDRPP